MTHSDARNVQIGGSHYIDLDIQPWDVMQAWMTADEYRGYIYGNVIKYLARYQRKGDSHTDLRKAHHYLETLISLLEVDTHL
ncbi:MAG: DUF3310 domain-containing protein [Pseudomonadales bacterium]